jgi:DNA polymerase III alpha subunit
METAFQTVIEQGRKALRTKFLHGIQFQAEPLFDAEIALIRGLNLEDALVRIATYGDQLRQRNVYFHTIGSGGSSIVLFVLGISRVNPVRHDTYFQRFWQTSSGEPPILQIVADSIGKPDFGEVSPPPYVSAHPMTMLEAISNRVESLIGAIKTTNLDQATLASLQAGDTEGVFQFHSERARWLLSQIRPLNIEELASVTALDQLSHSDPDIVISYLEQHREIVTTRCVAGRRPSAEAMHKLPVLFQEQLMGQLRHFAKLPWNDTYPFIRDAAKGRVDEQHNLWNVALGAMKARFPQDHEQLLRRIVESSRWATCRAHHVANALTSYKAAYCRIHHRMEFERVRIQIAESVEKGVESE